MKFCGDYDSDGIADVDDFDDDNDGISDLREGAGQSIILAEGFGSFDSLAEEQGGYDVYFFGSHNSILLPSRSKIWTNFP